MVRLTLPLIFISLVQGYIFNLINKKIGYLPVLLLIGLYFVFNYWGVIAHESSSLYLLENNIYSNSKMIYQKNKKEIEKKGLIYFKDKNNDRNNLYQSSQKLKLSYHDQSFLDHFFPGTKMKAVYGFETRNIAPKNAFVISSEALFKFTH
jgi:hypothetical protein